MVLRGTARLKEIVMKFVAKLSDDKKTALMPTQKKPAKVICDTPPRRSKVIARSLEGHVLLELEDGSQEWWLTQEEALNRGG